MASGATTVIIFKQPIFRFWWQVAGEIYVLTFIMRLSARLDKIKKHTWVFSLLKPRLPVLGGLIPLSALGTALSLCGPILMKIFVDKVLPSGKILYLALILLVISISMLLKSLAHGAYSYLSGRANQKLTLDIRSFLFERVMFLPLRFFITTEQGQLLSRLHGDASAVGGLLTGTMLAFFSSLLEAMGVIGVLLWLDYRLLVAILIAIPIHLAVTRYFKPRREKISAQLRESNSSLLSVITETITGIKTIKSFGAFSSRQEKFTSKAKTCYENAHSALKLSMFSSIARTVIDTVVWLSVMGYGGFLVLKGIITLGSLIAAYTLITRIFGPVQQIANTYLTIVASLVSLNRLSYLIQLQPTFDDGAKRKLEKIGDIQITDLTFGYDDKKKVLKGVNLIIPEGRMIGIVGESGVGKSTLLNLICRFYEPDEGTITAGNIDIREISIDCWRKQIALVDQDSFLFNCSIKENLLYGNPNAKMDEIIAVCEQSYIHHIIESSPDKYETIVGERGLALSNGEKQRLCIARALLKYPKILILDEATGFVDSESERQIRKSLTNLRKKGVTIIVVAHRLSMVRDADEIVLLQHGKIVERGTHKELLAAQGLYKRFYDASNRITEPLLD